MSSRPSFRVDPRLNTMLERVRNATFTRGARVVAFTAPHADAGTTLIATLFAQRLFEAGLKILLIDASMAPDPNAPAANWQPGDGAAAQMIATRTDGPDQLWIVVNPDDAGRFNDPGRLRAMFEQDLRHYDAIIIDCAPTIVGSGTTIEAMTIAAIAGATLLVGKANRTLGHEREAALLLLAECKADIAGILINDVIAPSLGAEIAREARRFRRFFPKLSSKIARWAEGVALFDIPA